MTPDQIQTRMASMLGNLGTLLDSEIITELQLAQVQLEHKATLPHVLLKEAYASTTVNEHRVAVPSDFLKEYEPSSLWYVDSNGVFHELCKAFQDDNRVYWDRESTGDDDTGGPQAYALVGGYFFLYPKPSAVYTIRMYYYAADAVLSDGGTANLWSTHYPELLMGIAGRNLLMHSGKLYDQTMSSAPLARFEQMVQEGWRSLLEKETSREMENMELSYGGG